MQYNKSILIDISRNSRVFALSCVRDVETITNVMSFVMSKELIHYYDVLSYSSTDTLQEFIDMLDTETFEFTEEDLTWKYQYPSFISVSTIKQINPCFTGTIINKFLGSPDSYCTNRFNRLYPIRLYSLTRVLNTVDTEEFKSIIEKTTKRKESAKNAMTTKESNLLNEINKFVVKLDRMDLDKIYNNAIRHYNNFQGQRELLYENCEARYLDKYIKDDKPFINRISVNYIRHQLTSYDTQLERLFNKVGKVKAYILIKSKVLDVIGTVYPEFKEECDRQKKQIESETHISE